MPIYDFRCGSCNKEFEEYLKSWREPNPNCPDCNGTTEKLVSRVSIDTTGMGERTLDCIVGADAERKWDAIHKRRETRRKENV